MATATRLVLDDPRDIAWAAGLFEGEGSISYIRKTGGVLVSLSSTDEDVVRRFQAVLGMGKVVPKSLGNPRWKPQWMWFVQSTDYEAFLASVGPYLGQRRWARAEEVRALRRQFIEDVTAERTCVGCGARFRPSSILGGRLRRYCTASCRATRATRRWRAKESYGTL